MEKTFVIQVEYPDGDHIPTQEFVENIQEYFAANIMDGERGRLIVKPVYQPKRDSLYQECLNAVPEEIKETFPLEVEFSNFVSLVKRMRDAQKDVIYKSMFSSLDSARPTAYEVAKTKQIVLEQEVDEYLKKKE